MTTQEEIVRLKLSILELAEYFKNVSEACRINGVSRPQAVYQKPGGSSLKVSFRKKLYRDIQTLQTDLDEYMQEYWGVFKILCHMLGSGICSGASESKSQLREWAFNLPRRRSWLLLERGS